MRDLTRHVHPSLLYGKRVSIVTFSYFHFQYTLGGHVSINYNPLTVRSVDRNVNVLPIVHPFILL